VALDRFGPRRTVSGVFLIAVAGALWFSRATSFGDAAAAMALIGVGCSPILMGSMYFFGRTAPPELLAPGIDVLLGSDSLLTAEGSLLHELRVARHLGLLTSARLSDAVGATAARRLGLAPPSLVVGSRADVVVLRRPLLEATEADVVVVVADGALRVVDPVLLPPLGSLAARGRIDTGGDAPRWLCDQPSSAASSSERERGERTSVSRRVAR
jgi:hypothetical protein